MQGFNPVPRFIALLFIAAIAALTTGCASVSTTQAGAIGIDRKQYFVDGSREMMVKDSAKSYDRLLNLALEHHALNADSAVTQRVTAIANRLIPHVTHFRPDAADWTWEVNVLTIDRVNATCMAGGKISVYTGLIQQLQPTDDELAAVIGHEIGHALRDHSAEKYSTQKRNNGVATGVGAVLSVGLAVVTGVNMSNTVMAASQTGAEAFANLPNSRELEQESDRIGLELMARAGYDPRAAAGLWNKFAALGNKAGAKGNETAGSAFWSTHPSDQSRIDDLTAYQPRVAPLYAVAVEENRRQAAIDAEQQAIEARRVADAKAATPMPAPAGGEALTNNRNGKASKATKSSSKKPAKPAATTPAAKGAAS